MVVAEALSEREREQRREAGCRVGEYNNGKTLSTQSNSSLIVNPLDIKEAYDLHAWRKDQVNNGGFKTVSVSSTGGGAGGLYSTGGSHGTAGTATDGGGNGGIPSSATSAEAGTANTGGGAGGQGTTPAGPQGTGTGKSGGSGIVIIRYRFQD